MRFVFVTPYLDVVPGGLEQDLIQLAVQFTSQGEEVAIVTTPYRFPTGMVDLERPFAFPVAPGTNILRISGRWRSRLRGIQPSNAPLWLPRLTRSVLELCPDVIIVYNIGWPVSVAASLRHWRRHAVVLYRTAYHPPQEQGLTKPLDPLRRWVQLGTADLAHRLVAFSEFEKGQLIRDGPTPAERICVVYPGVTTHEFTLDEIQEFQATYGLAGKCVISHVARLSAFKGTDRLIRVLPHVRQRTGRDVVLLLGGRNVEEDYLDWLVRELGVEAYVHFTGPLPERDLHLAYAASDVFALPSKYESFGFVFLEAMAYGVPILGVRTGGVPELIRPGESGFLLRSADDDRGLQQALERLVLDRSLRKEMGERAQHFVRDRFTWERAAAEFKEWIARMQSA
jgi:glycosyltransferase involved in cell wall biosynthesis